MAAVHPLKSTCIPSNSYVLSLVSHSDCFAASASSPSDAIYLLDKSDLHEITSIQAHPGGITGIRSVPGFAGTNTSSVLVSCGKDGTVKVWDHRTTNQVAIKMNSSGEDNAGLLCCDVSPNGYVVVAGTESHDDGAEILYWDARKPTLKMHAHSSTHSDDITVVQFAPSVNALLSASSDGLLSLSNPAEPDEDEAVTDVGNWGASIAQAGWYEDGIWAASDMETFSLWTPELDKSTDFNLRDDLPQQLPPNQAVSWQPDYLIGCHPSADNLSLFIGSNFGSFSILSPPYGSTPSWTVDGTYAPHHEGIVRAVLWDKYSGRLLTGGEDSKINLWEWSPPGSPEKPLRKREFHEDMDVDDNQEHKKARWD